jgi:hypothetical protein
MGMAAVEQSWEALLLRRRVSDDPQYGMAGP